MTTPVAPVPPSVWADRDFRLYWLASTISISGMVVSLVALPVLVFRLTDSALLTSLLGTFQVLPYLVFGLIAGAVADRVNRKHLLIACNLISALLLLTIPLAALLDHLTLPHIYAVALLSATVFVWADAANFGAVPSLVGRERIVPANSAIWAAASLADIAVPALVGVLIALIDPALAIGLDALAFLGAAGLRARIRKPFNAPRSADDRLQTVRVAVSRTVADVREGLRFLWQQRLVRVMTLTGFGNSFTSGAIRGLLVVYAVRALGLANDDPRIGVLFTAGAVGGLISSVALPRLTQRFPVGHVTLASLLVTPLCVLGLVMAPTFWLGCTMYLLWSTGSTLTILNGIALRQLVTPEHLLSRVNTSARMVAWGGQPFGAAIGGVLAQVTDIRVAYLIMGLGVLASAVAGWFSPLRDGASVAQVEAQEGVL